MLNENKNYLSPEMLNGLGYSIREADTWAFGVILYRLLIGKFPFED